VNIFDLGRIKTSIWLGAALLFVCVLGAGHVEAAKVPKVGICHFDEDTGLFHLINVSMNAQAAHLAHGDGLPEEFNGSIGIGFDDECNIVPPGPAVLAHAFIDIGDNDRVYNPMTDFSIALLEDTDGSGNVSIGDEITLSSYPLNFDPQDATDLGSWTAQDHVVGGILSDTMTHIGVTTMTPAIGMHAMNWFTPPDDEGDRFDEADTAAPINIIRDNVFGDNLAISTDPLSPGAPDIPVISNRPPGGDDRFLQVVIP